MGRLNDLKPGPLWKYFEEICQIPRISGNEDKIRKYLLDFADRNGLDSKEDKAGNILITREASPGYENIKTVVLQSHMDMVGEKNADNPHNWKTDPIKPEIRNGWVTATGTTLGADDGIGIAAQMAVLSDSNLETGKIECLFTVDEESGMTGAINLSPDFISGRTLLNLDSEDEGILYIGCAGGMDTVGTLTYEPVAVQSGEVAIELSVSGLRGGHSGDEIHKGFGNAVKIINKLIIRLSEKYNIRLSKLDAGNLRNAIAREAFAVIVTRQDLKGQIIDFTNKFHKEVIAEYRDIEKEIKISATNAVLPEFTMDEESQKKLTEALECCPHGVIRWSEEMEDLVQTSTNLASAKSAPDNKVIIVSTQRSSVEAEKHEAGDLVAQCLAKAGAKVKQSDGYPGWQPDLSSQILTITRNSYRKLFGKDPQVRAIHAGLECGLIFEKIKGTDMISFGPTIRGAHTPEEKIEISTSQMFWDLLIDVIRSMPEKQ
jgi:dipeptidase D